MRIWIQYQYADGSEDDPRDCRGWPNLAMARAAAREGTVGTGPHVAYVFVGATVIATYRDGKEV